MEQYFVTKEIAEKLKDLGFNEKCIALWLPLYGKQIFDALTYTDIAGEWELQFGDTPSNSEDYNKDDIYLLAPLYEQAINWLSEKHNVDIWKINSKEGYNISYLVDSDPYSSPPYHETVYKPTIQEAILHSIELIIEYNEEEEEERLYTKEELIACMQNYLNIKTKDTISNWVKSYFNSK